MQPSCNTSPKKLCEVFSWIISTPLMFFSDAWHYREYLLQSVIRDFKKRYKRSILGYIWSMLSPLFMMIILAIVFSSMMGDRVENYVVFLFAATLPWNFFDSTVKSCLGVIRNNANILEKIPVPKTIFISATVCSNVVDFFLSLVPLILVMLATGHGVHWTILFFPFMLIPLIMITLGFASVVATGNVFFEDTEHLLGIFMRAFYFLTPILYSRDMLPAWLQDWIHVNPMFGITELCRELVYYGSVSSVGAYVFVTIYAICVMTVGLMVFRSSEKKFIYFI